MMLCFSQEISLIDVVEASHDECRIELHRNAIPSLIYGRFGMERLRDLYTPVSNKDVGWRQTYKRPSYSAVAKIDDQVVCAAHLAPVIMERSGELGMNLSYAVSEHFQGKGLATRVCAHLLCTSISATEETEYPISLINVQTPAANARSCALAQRLGLDPATEGNFTREGKSFIAFRGAPDLVSDVCAAHIRTADAEEAGQTPDRPRGTCF